MNKMNPRYKFGICAWNEKQQCRTFFIVNADGAFRSREIRRLEPQIRWDIVAECEMKICLRTTPQGAERLDRISEAINEALA